VSALAVYLNPAAGGGRGAAVHARLAARLPELAAARLARSRAELAAALAEGADRLLSVGGDGTLNLVVNAIAAADALGRVAVGVVPAGTGCDFGRAFGLPREPLAAARRALAAAPRPVDLLELDCCGERRLVVNVASAGVSGRVDEMVNASPGRGQLAYLAATLRGLARYRPVPVRVALDGEPWYEGPIFLVAVANGTSFGKGMRVAPRARADDGVADVVLVRELPRWRLPLELPRIYLGSHLERPFVAWRQAREVALEPQAPLPPLDVDGETAPSGAFRVRVLPGALRLLA
jgi:diacylglycerol kinase (ATP)